MRRMFPKTFLPHPFVGTNRTIPDDVLVLRTALLALQAQFFTVDNHIKSISGYLVEINIKTAFYTKVL